MRRMHSLPARISEWARMAGDWLREAYPWQIALLVVVALVLLPLMPAVLLLAVAAALVLFARAWVREFTTLMRLGDDAFPGHNDKLIWATLLIVLPPIGVWLFGTYREAHWPEAKPKGPAVDPVDY